MLEKVIYKIKYIGEADPLGHRIESFLKFPTNIY